MRIIIKPAGMAVLLASILGLAFLIVATHRRGRGGAMNPSNGLTATVASTGPASPGGMPYTLETPDSALRNSGLESDYGHLQPYAPVRATLSGEIAGHWYDDSSWATITVDYGRETTAPHGGGACQRIMVKQIDKGRCQFAQALHLVSGRTYTAGLWLRADHPMKVRLLLRQAAKPTRTYCSKDATIGTEWQQVSTTGPIGADPVTYEMLEILETGTVWVDDATLTH